MTTGKIRMAIVTERVAWVRKMVQGIRDLPLSTYQIFLSDPRNPAAVESHLRRALEALLDLGRHVLAKGFALAPAEYGEVAKELTRTGILTEKEGALLRQMAGYRNRMVHFYHEISQEELYEIVCQHLSDVECVCDAILRWLAEHPEKVDSSVA